MKIYNLGSLNIDYVYYVPYFVRPGETLYSENRQTFPGGKGLNQSIALARAGAKTVHCGRIGEDGEFLKNILENAGVDTTYVETLPGATGHAIIQVDADGQNCILLFGGTNHSFTKDFIHRALDDAQAGDMLLLQNEINNLDLIFAVAEEKKLQIAFNPSPFDCKLLDLPLSQVKWWICNEIEGAELTGKQDPEEIIAEMSHLFPNSNIVLTLGKDGCIYRNGKSMIHQPIFEIEAVDTTAAGDTFTGFFLASVAAGKSDAEALLIASKASAIAVSRKGASVSIPTLDEVYEF